jgi:hypothetical protein
MRVLLFVFVVLFHLQSCAQKKVDLNALKLTENVESLTKDIPDVHKGNMFDRTDMVSYGVSKNTVFYYGNFLPGHVEILSYKGLVAGYAFKIKSFKEQQQIADYINKTYKNIVVKKDNVVTSYTYQDAKVMVELRSVDEAQFRQNMNGYFMVRRPDFNAEYERLMK